MTVKDIETDEIARYRVEKFEQVGFNKEQAIALVDAKDTGGFALYWGDAKKLLDKGATKEQVVAIYAEDD